MSKGISQTVIISEFILRENANALRHLHSNAAPVQPPGGLARQLINDWLQRPHDDPGYWLEHTWGSETAILALALILDYATQVRGIAKKAADFSANNSQPNEGAAIQAKYGLLYGDLITSMELESFPSSWVEEVDGLEDASQLADMFSQLRRHSGLMSQPSPSFSLTDPARDTLLADLLYLPDSVNPAQWLQENRLPLAAKFVLDYLVQASLPSRHLSKFVTAGKHTHSLLAPKVDAHVGQTLSVRVEQIDFYEDGFLIHLSIKYRLPRRHPPRKQGHSTYWDGFQHISDNNGYRYLVQRADLDISKHLRWWQEQLTLVCWPSVGDARQLILQASPTALSMYRPPSNGSSLIAVSTPSLGDLHCSVTLAD